MNQSTGLLLTEMPNGDGFRGSACVARDGYLLYSCAHVLYENGQWASDYDFYGAYHSTAYPSSSDKSGETRGFRYFTSYSNNESFNLDYVVIYGYSSFGQPAPYYPGTGVSVMKTNFVKKIIGYPAKVDYTGIDGHRYQHNTPNFRNRFTTDSGAYLGVNGVSTGSGNSGGPLFVRGSNGVYGLAGILISGTNTSAGVRALDFAAHNMATTALRGIGRGPGVRTRTIRNTSSLLLPDGTTRYSRRASRLSGFNGGISRLVFSCTFRTTYRADLDVYLRSPAGRVYWVTRDSGGSRNNLFVRNRTITGRFRGTNPNGLWNFYMRDDSRRDRCRFVNYTMTVSD